MGRSVVRFEIGCRDCAKTGDYYAKPAHSIDTSAA